MSMGPIRVGVLGSNAWVLPKTPRPTEGQGH